MAIIRLSDELYINTDRIEIVEVKPESDVIVRFTDADLKMALTGDTALNFRNWLSDTALDYRPPEGDA